MVNTNIQLSNTNLYPNLISLNADTLNSIFEICSLKDLFNVACTCTSMRTNSRNAYQNKIFITLKSKEDYSLAAKKLNVLLFSNDEQDIKVLDEIFKMHQLQPVSRQIDFCKNLFAVYQPNQARPQLNSLLVQLFNRRSSPKAFKIKILDYINSMNIQILHELKWNKRLREKGFVPKKIDPFSLVEVPANLATKIKMHPEHKFQNGEVVAVVARNNNSGFSSLYLGVVYVQSSNNYSISLELTEKNEYKRLHVKKAFEVGKLPRNCKYQTSAIK